MINSISHHCFSTIIRTFSDSSSARGVSRTALTTKTIPTFDDMKKRMAPIWEEEEFKEYVLWAGIFGSVARNRAHSESDVDIVCVFKDHLRNGEPVDLREREFCPANYVSNTSVS
jgi:Nucleotidyltransferase domain